MSGKKIYGKLWVVATPIGNFDDFTFRGTEILRSVDTIYCEDTRVSGKLLKHFEIKKTLKVLNARQESKIIPAVIAELKAGKNIALLCDAGTPAISDPGVRLVNECRREGLEVSGAPGANAAVYALSIAGIATDSFIFEGFLPQKKGRQKKLAEICEEKRTVVLYESVYRVSKLLNELEEFCPGRFLAVGRELTKMFEEIVRGYPAELKEYFEGKKLKGEFVFILAPLNWKNEE